MHKYAFNHDHIRCVRACVRGIVRCHGIVALLLMVLMCPLGGLYYVLTSITGGSLLV